MLIGDEPSLLVVSRMRGGAGLLVAGVPLSADIPRVMQKTALMEVALIVRRPGQAPQGPPRCRVGDTGGERVLSGCLLLAKKNRTSRNERVS